MKIWKLLIGLFGLVCGLFAVQASKKKEVKELEEVIKKNKKEEKKVEVKIKKLEEEKVVSKKEIGNLKRKLTNSKKKTEKMQTAYDEDDVESAESFLNSFAKNK
jgi:septal ring factor EnvC (AmiA/AmiB activator)